METTVYLTERLKRLLQAFVVEILVVTGSEPGVVKRVCCKHLRPCVHRTLEVAFTISQSARNTNVGLYAFDYLNTVDSLNT